MDGQARPDAIAALGDRGRLGPRAALPPAALATAGLFALSPGSGPEDVTFTFCHPIASVRWTVLILSTVHVRQRAAWYGFLTVRWLTATGLVGYSLFIWHEPVMLQSHRAGLLPTAQSGFP